MNQDGEAAGPASAPNAAWGPMRVVFLPYASDPVTFFDYRGLYREPDWMLPPPGLDVSKAAARADDLAVHRRD
jgi:uncharacterized membrane protein